jgi:hypothetical protein
VLVTAKMPTEKRIARCRPARAHPGDEIANVAPKIRERVLLETVERAVGERESAVLPPGGPILEQEMIHVFLHWKPTADS